MLAKEQKIGNLKLQREAIKKKSSSCSGAAFTYVGEVYPENQTHFKDEGYDIIKIPMEFSAAITGGLPLYLFKVREDITLTAEEMEMAESVVTTTEAIHESVQNGVETIKESAGALKENAADAIVKFLGGTRE